MGSRYEVEVTVVSAKNLKNVNWKHGELRPYAVLWVDPAAKCSVKVALDGGDDGVDPVWDEKLTVPLAPGRTGLDDAVLFVDVVHANAKEGTKPLVGSARLPLREVVDEAGIGGKATRTLKLKRPSGRPQGKLELRIAVREPAHYYDPPPPALGTGSYGYQSRDLGYGAPPPSGYPYAAAPPRPDYGYGAPPPSGYPYSAAPPPSGYPYGAPPQPVAGYAQTPAYGQASSYGQQPYAAAEQGKKKSKFGMGTGLAVGAAAGVLGGLALAEGVDHLEDKIADKAAEKVEDDLGYDDGGDF